MRNAKTGGFGKTGSVGAKRKPAASAAPGKVASVPDTAIEAAALATVVNTVDAPVAVPSLAIPVEPAVPAAVAAVSEPASSKRDARPVRAPARPAPAPSPSIETAAADEPASMPDAPAPTPDPIPTLTAAEENPVNDTIQTVTDKTQTMFADANERTKGAMEKGKVMIEELNSFSKGNIEAMVESSKIAAKGIETMAQDTAEYAKTSFEGATQAMKTMATVKSPTELMKLQSDYMRTAFDAMVAHTSRSTEAMMKLAGDVAQPLSSRMAIAAEKMKVAA